MEECEALCTRMGIMVNGQFKCLGKQFFPLDLLIFNLVKCGFFPAGFFQGKGTLFTNIQNTGR